MMSIYLFVKATMMSIPLIEGCSTLPSISLTADTVLAIVCSKHKHGWKIYNVSSFSLKLILPFFVLLRASQVLGGFLFFLLLGQKTAINEGL